MTITLEHKKGRVYIKPVKSGKSLISVYPNGWDRPKTSWETSYPTELIQTILSVKGVDFLCDEIRRDEDPAYTQNLLRYAVSAYMGKEKLNGARVLDFGQQQMDGRKLTMQVTLQCQTQRQDMCLISPVVSQ